MQYYNPNILSLYLKFFSLVIIYIFTGYLVVGTHTKKSIYFNLTFYLFFGICVQFLLGFYLAELDIKTKFLPFLLLPLAVYRLIHFYINKIDFRMFCIINILKRKSRIREVSIFFICLILSSTFYFTPFISQNTSGFYAYGGGDQTSYFGVSEFVYDNTLKENYENLSKYTDHGNYKYEQNFPVKSLSFYLYHHQNWILAPQFIAVSPVAFAPIYPEESYTAFIAILLFTMNSFVVFLLGKFQIKISYKTFLTLFFLSVIASGGLSLAWKHATPALFSWITTLVILLLLILSKHKRIEFLTPLVSAVLALVSFLLYLPSFVLGIIPCLYLLKNSLKENKISLIFVVQALIIFLTLGNLYLQYPVKLSLNNALDDRMLLNYGINYLQCVKAITGIIDFESLLSFPKHEKNILDILHVSIILLGLILYLFIKKSQRNLILFVIILFTTFISIYYYFKNGHYHVIRLIEFCSVLVFPVSTYSILNFILKKNRSKFQVIRKYFLILLMLILILGVIDNRVFVFNLFKNPDYKYRASLKDSNSLLLTNDLKKIENYLEKYFFWMHYGSVESANNQIMFRNVKYFENSEYDYLNSFNIDILSIDILNKSTFIFPSYLQNRIIFQNYPKDTPQYKVMNDFKVYDSEFGIGAVLVGAGFVSSSIANNYYIRPHLEAGIFIWNHLNKSINIEFEFYVDVGKFIEENTLTIRELEGSKISVPKNFMNDINGIDLKKTPYEKKESMNTGSNFNSNLETEYFWYRYENGDSIPANLKNKFSIGDRNFKLTRGINKIKLHAGNEKFNVFRFIPRDSKGARGGKDMVLANLFPNNPEKSTFLGKDLPLIEIRKVNIVISDNSK